MYELTWHDYKHKGNLNTGISLHESIQGQWLENYIKKIWDKKFFTKQPRTYVQLKIKG